MCFTTYMQSREESGIEATRSNTISELAGEAYDYFTTRTRGEGPDAKTIVVLKDERPEWVYELVREAHGDNFLPDDWRYRTTRDALGFIHDNVYTDPDDMASEFADGNVDVYTAARFEWLSSNLTRQSYCDEAIEEFGIERGENSSIADQIGMGQYFESQEVLSPCVGRLRIRQTPNHH